MGYVTINQHKFFQAPYKTLKIVICLLLIFFTFFTVTFTSKDIGWTWDEVYYFLSSQLQIEWARALFVSLVEGNFGHVLSQKTIDAYWLWDTYHNPHPPLYKIFSGLGWIIFRDVLGDFTAFRLASAVCCAILIFTLFIAIEHSLGLLPAIYGSLSLLLIPRMYGHAHLATTEIFLTTFWFLSYWAFWKGLTRISGSILLGVFLGCGIATKFTGLLIPFPFLLWTLMFRQSKALRNCILALILAPLIAVLVNPGWWHQPFYKILSFFQASLAREGSIPITTLFFGKIYPFSPPWTYSLVMIVTTLPLSTLFTFIIGIVALTQKKYHNPYNILFALNIPFIFAVTMLPNAPVHDGIRQFIYVLPFLAYVAGIGFDFLRERIASLFRSKTVQTTAIACSLMFLIGYSAKQLRTIHPYELCYYNELIGGVKGAHAKGMETTYWFDVVNAQFLTALERKIPVAAKISVWPPNGEYFEFLQKKGKLRQDLRFLAPKITIIRRKKGFHFRFKPEIPDYLILLARQGSFNLFYRSIYTKHVPLYSATLEGVPLISIYCWKDIQREWS